MTPEELADFTAKLKVEIVANEACFGIFQYGEDSGESFIKANKQGLQLFAAELLRASTRVYETLAHETETIIPFDFEDDNWLDGDIFISYIEPVSYSAASWREVKPKALFDRFSDKLQHYVLVSFGAFLFISLLVGIGNGIKTITEWLFG